MTVSALEALHKSSAYLLTYLLTYEPIDKFPYLCVLFSLHS